MINRLKFIHNSQRKRSGSAQKSGGFTLIELLVAIILAALVITPLLGFMINILATDRREQAKAKTEQDIQSALDYMAQDLEQAVYIYDGKGVGEIADELPSIDDATPVLVFWTRKYLPQTIHRDTTINRNNPVCPTPGERAEPPECNDAFVFSLVAYYLIKGEGDDSAWSDAARIARFEIHDGIRNPNNPTKPDDTPNYLDFDDERYEIDAGFKLFNLGEEGTTEKAMNAWEKGGDYDLTNNPPSVLIDYIDQTDDDNLEPDEDKCTSVLGIDSDRLTEIEDKGTTKEQLKTPVDADFTSFYACVDVENTVAHVVLRGNALARIKPNAEYSENSPYFPSAERTIKGRGFLFKQ
ncbi:MAG: hormogonium polysaccharide secretion pseudopilin HpsC [Coleofasciculus sp. D1-CHI-01]|uniref:hormogonium polysaccharide secretion pseudopilin HpsC n=1 Tax=Coleofasciculus sp. D1-CHI-01 TaxID=3068482 RepID=UPI0032FDEB3C